MMRHSWKFPITSSTETGLNDFFYQTVWSRSGSPACFYMLIVCLGSTTQVCSEGAKEACLYREATQPNNRRKGTLNRYRFKVTCCHDAESRLTLWSVFFLGKSPFLTIQLLPRFSFGHQTSKPDIFDHPTLKTVHNWPSSGFDGWF
jgi:hypothetical protein